MSDSDVSDDEAPKCYLANLDKSSVRSETAGARKKELLEYVDHLKLQGHHALSAEIDRTLKKVNEGVDEVIAAFEALETSADPAVKEKSAEILKKEVRKLQKHRDGMAPWINSNKFKDKKILLEHRALIERQMSRWKYLEKRVKVKEYSEIGLNRPNSKPVNRTEKDREELRNWLVNVIDKLKQLTDLIELDIDQLLEKKGKKSWKESDLEKMKTMKGRNEFHLDKFEALLRMLHNLTVQSDEILEFMNQVKKIKDDIEYYLEAWREPDFEENEFLYDDIVGIDENKICQPPLPSPPLPVSASAPAPTPSKLQQNISGGGPVKASKSTSKTLTPASLTDLQSETPVERQQGLNITSPVPEVSSWPNLQARKPLVDCLTKTGAHILKTDKIELPNKWLQSETINRNSQLKGSLTPKTGPLQKVSCLPPLPNSTNSSISPPPGFFDLRMKTSPEVVPIKLPPMPSAATMKVSSHDNGGIIEDGGYLNAVKGPKISIPTSLTDLKSQTPKPSSQPRLSSVSSVPEISAWPNLHAGKPSGILTRSKPQAFMAEPPGFRRSPSLCIENSVSNIPPLPQLNIGKQIDNLTRAGTPSLLHEKSQALSNQWPSKQATPRSIPYQFKGTPTTKVTVPRQVSARPPPSLPISFLDISPPPGFCPRIRIPKLDFIGTYIPNRSDHSNRKSRAQCRLRLGLRNYDDIFKRMDGDKAADAQKENQNSPDPSKLEFGPDLLNPEGGVKTVGDHVKEFLDTFFRSKEVKDTGILPDINDQNEFDAYMKSLTGYYAPDFFPEYWPS